MGLSLPRFYRGEDDFLRLHDRLKSIPCPSCHATETLNLHGSLMGYSERDDARKTQRGYRILCSNRKVCRSGCGRTFGVFSADTLRRLRLVGAASLWAFLSLVLKLGNTAQALRESLLDFSLTSAYRLWHRFNRCGASLRVGLAAKCPPPTVSDSPLPAALTAAHLVAAFPAEPSPIAAYQHTLQRDFLERF